jgi:hypothetical protein
VASAIADKDMKALPGERAICRSGGVSRPHGGRRRPARFGDVVEAVTAKMIRRHPHVFFGEKARPDGGPEDFWEAQESERTASGQTGLLDDVASALPALTRAEKRSAAPRVGFDWNDPPLVLDKVAEEAREVLDAPTRRSAWRSAICCSFSPIWRVIESGPGSRPAPPMKNSPAASAIERCWARRTRQPEEMEAVAGRQDPGL